MCCKAPADFSFWTNFWRGPERLIFGHSVLDRPLVTQWAVGVDTGAVFGRGLTALVLPNWKLKTVATRDTPEVERRSPATPCRAAWRPSADHFFPVRISRLRSIARAECVSAPMET